MSDLLFYASRMDLGFLRIGFGKVSLFAWQNNLDPTPSSSVQNIRLLHFSTGYQVRSLLQYSCTPKSVQPLLCVDIDKNGLSLRLQCSMVVFLEIFSLFLAYFGYYTAKKVGEMLNIRYRLFCVCYL